MLQFANMLQEQNKYKLDKHILSRNIQTLFLLLEQCLYFWPEETELY